MAVSGANNVYIPHRFSPEKAFTNPRYRQGVLTESGFGGENVQQS
jgi:rRNA maturation protein Nop10